MFNRRAFFGGLLGLLWAATVGLKSKEVLGKPSEVVCATKERLSKIFHGEWASDSDEAINPDAALRWGHFTRNARRRPSQTVVMEVYSDQGWSLEPSAFTGHYELKWVPSERPKSKGVN